MVCLSSCTICGGSCLDDYLCSRCKDIIAKMTMRGEKFSKKKVLREIEKRRMVECGDDLKVFGKIVDPSGLLKSNKRKRHKK